MYTALPFFIKDHVGCHLHLRRSYAEWSGLLAAFLPLSMLSNSFGVACDLLVVHLLSMPPERAGACAPGIPDSSNVPHILAVVCIYAAACDLAIADAGFRTTCTGAQNVMVSLFEMAREVHRAFPRNPDTEGLLVLIDFQLARLMAADIQVRKTGSEASVVWQ